MNAFNPLQSCRKCGDPILFVLTEHDVKHPIAVNREPVTPADYADHVIEAWAEHQMLDGDDRPPSRVVVRPLTAANFDPQLPIWLKHTATCRNP